MAKADNLLAVLWLLRSRGRMTAPAIADALEVSVRTVYRYIDGLCASGVPVLAETGPEGGYSLPERFRGAPLVFEPDELVAIFQAALVAKRAGMPKAGALETALAKVWHNLSERQVTHLERHTDAMLVSDWVRGGPVEPWLSDLEQAAAEGATLELAYRKPDQDSPEPRVIDPYGLLYRAGLWYLVGFCHTRQALREFRVDRIAGLSRTGATFERPKQFELERGYSDEWIRKRAKAGPLAPVRVKGSPGAIASLCEHWYLKHFPVERKAGEAAFWLDPAGRSQLPGYLLSFGSELTVLEPSGLRDEMANLAERWAKHHRKAIEDP